MNRPLTVAFDQIEPGSLPIVGGKGANLGALAQAAMPVPPGFCVTTEAFAQFMAGVDSADLFARLDALGADDVDEVRRVGSQVRATLLESPVPPRVADAVIGAWRSAGSEEAYAVRSSATAEDLPEASFAGQQDTYLNVLGAADLIDAVHRCWVSLFTDRAIVYRIRNGFAHDEVGLSVVVQQMVMAEISGVAFSADPLTSDRTLVTIDAAFGLGEALVSGAVTPDAYKVEKATLSIVDRNVADKKIAIVGQPGGGVATIELGPERRSRPALDDVRIQQVAELTRRVEDHYGQPQDVEWAFAGNQLFLLQARPITSLFPVDQLTSPDGTLHVFFSMGHQQNMTGAMTPLGLSTVRCVIPFGHKDGTIESSHVGAAGGRLYADITPALRHPVARRVVPGLLGSFHALAPDTLRLAMAREGLEGSGPPASPRFLVFVAGLGRQVLASLFWRDLTGVPAEAMDVIDQTGVSLRRSLEDLDDEALVARLVQAMPELILPALHWIPAFMAGELARRLVGRLAEHWELDGVSETFDLGLPGNAVTDMNLALGDLAETARANPELIARFDQLDGGGRDWLAAAAEVEGSVPFLSAMESFLGRYGSRGTAEIDLAAPRWHEEPIPLLQVIASSLQQPAGSHTAQPASVDAARTAAWNALRRRAGRGPLGPLRRRLLDRLLHVVEHGSVLREHHKFLVVEQLRIVKEFVGQLAEALVDDGVLADRDDIWFFSWPEIQDLQGQNRLDAETTATERRAEHGKYQTMTPPMVITSDGAVPIADYDVDAPPGALVGSPVSGGVVEGVARVVHDPSSETVEPGEVLVASFTDPGWTPLFVNSAALVMEVGGLMTHGSVVAREYGIPAVVGVRGATERIKSGDRIRVDGDQGFVMIINSDG